MVASESRVWRVVAAPRRCPSRFQLAVADGAVRRRPRGTGAPAQRHPCKLKPTSWFYADAQIISLHFTYSIVLMPCLFSFNEIFSWKISLWFKWIFWRKLVEVKDHSRVAVFLEYNRKLYYGVKLVWFWSIFYCGKNHLIYFFTQVDWGEKWHLT